MTARPGLSCPRRGFDAGLAHAGWPAFIRSESRLKDFWLENPRARELASHPERFLHRRYDMMNKVILSLLTASVLFAGCVTPPSAMGSPTPAGATQTPSGATTSGPATSLGRVVLLSSSLSLIVEDPAASMAELERRIAKAGGYVTSASASSTTEGGYANLSARVPVDSLTELRLAARDGALQTQYDSTYSQDVTTEYESLIERKGQLAEAEDAVWSLMVETTDRQRVASLQLLLDLLHQEALNIDGQLEYYHNDAGLASLDVTFNSTPPTLYPTLLAPYPTWPVPTPTPTAAPIK